MPKTLKELNLNSPLTSEQISELNTWVFGLADYISSRVSEAVNSNETIYHDLFKEIKANNVQIDSDYMDKLKTAVEIFEQENDMNDEKNFTAYVHLNTLGSAFNILSTLTERHAEMGEHIATLTNLDYPSAIGAASNLLKAVNKIFDYALKKDEFLIPFQNLSRDIVNLVNLIDESNQSNGREIVLVDSISRIEQYLSVIAETSEHDLLIGYLSSLLDELNFADKKTLHPDISDRLKALSSTEKSEYTPSASSKDSKDEAIKFKARSEELLKQVKIGLEELQEASRSLEAIVAASRQRELAKARIQNKDDMKDERKTTTPKIISSAKASIKNVSIFQRKDEKFVSAIKTSPKTSAKVIITTIGNNSAKSGRTGKR